MENSRDLKENIKIWKEKCFMESRLRDSLTKKDSKDARTVFDNDYSRIINSSALRRLQDKAQVFPLKKGDFVRSRLTHSLEVSHFGHTMGLSITKQLGEKGEGLELLDIKNYTKLSGILSTAGLVHDFGNPPFGHFGEEVIKQFFQSFFLKDNTILKKSYKEKYKNYYLSTNDGDNTKFFIYDINNKKIKSNNELDDKEKEVLKEILKNTNGGISEEVKKEIKDLQDKGFHIISLDEINDLCSFDGNAQTFRILSKLQYNRDSYGLNLTQSLLATVIKYPFSACEGRKKFGYFLTEKETYNKIKETLKLNGRHPVVYLLEAADDIAYSVADIEDGLKKKIFNKNFILEKLEEVEEEVEKKENINDLKFNKNEITENLNINKYFEEFEKNNENKINGFSLEQRGLYLLKKAIFLLENLKEDNNLSFLQDFRIFFQSIMLKEVQNYYVENFSEILNNFDNPEDKTNILEESAAKYLREACKKISSKIFRSNEIVEAEILGYQVLNTLLEKFTNCILQKSCTDIRSYEGKICSLISENYKELNFCISPYSYLGLNKDEITDKEIMKGHIYNKIRCVIDFVSGMTDSFALEIYKKIMYR